MVSSELKASMVIAGRGARACDMCVKERARWYCAADDAYLCERCDDAVHSANAVAKRHERVKLGPNGAPVKLKPSRSHKRKNKSNPPLISPLNLSAELVPQKWSNSSKKRPRTPRKLPNLSSQCSLITTPGITPEPSKHAIVKEENSDTLLLYDLLMADDQIGDPSGTAIEVKTEPFSPSSTLTFLNLKAEETDFTHEVPTYEPLLQDLIQSSHDDLMQKLMPTSPSLCNVSCTSRVSTTSNRETVAHQLCPESSVSKNGSATLDEATEQLHVNDLVEGSTGDIKRTETMSEDSDIDTFDVMDLCSSAAFDDDMEMELQEGFPDIEAWKAAYVDQEAGCCSFVGYPFKGKEVKELDTCYINVDDLQNETIAPCLQQQWPQQQQQLLKKPLSLRLDYEDVMNTWSDRGSLWMDGQRPQTVPDVNLGILDCGMLLFRESSCNSSQAGQVPSLVVATNSGREARVLRYKEKRHTRLFSKKIRYEVRRLNAERRPRMKGRFVKRAAIAAM